VQLLQGDKAMSKQKAKNNGEYWEIKLGKQKVLIDHEDLDLLTNHYFRIKTWRGGEQYVYSGTTGEYKNKFLHRIILGRMRNIKGKVCDHINGNPFDNRRSNLRACNFSENSKNAKMQARNKIGIKGLHDDERLSLIIATIQNKHKKYKRTFKYGGWKRNRNQAIVEAKLWRDKMEMKLHGEFSVIKSRGLK
jgi:hypothetical protein